MIINNLSIKEQRVLFAKLAGIAYLDLPEAKKEAKKLGFTKAVLVDIEGAQTFVFTNKHDCAIACRGTEPTEMNDIYADLEIFKADSVSGNKVHQGFKEEVDKVFSDVEVLVNKFGDKKDIWVCGHSLGGAMATILGQRLEVRGVDVDTLFTFGSPRAGGPNFSKWCDEHLNHQRFVNNNDVVPCVPTALRWRHTGLCYYIKSTGEVTNLGRWSTERIRDKGWSLLNTIVKGRLDLIADHNIDDYILHLEDDLNASEIS
jgi:triacylglycerol lipase